MSSSPEHQPREPSPEAGLALALAPLAPAPFDLRLLRARFGSYLELTKPSLTTLVVVTTLLGLTLAGTPVPFAVLLATLAGTALTGGGACALNMVMEGALDARMKRTQARPLPSGRVSESEAVLFGASLVALGGAILWAFTNPLTALLSLLAATVYIFLYTPAKRRSPWATLLGAVPGALPPVMGYTAATGSLGLAGWLVFAILFFWQLPHFWALAILYRDDYARGGFRLWPSRSDDPRPVERRIVATTALLALVSLLPYLAGAAGVLYVSGAAALGGWFFWQTLRLLLGHSRQDARRVFLSSIVYLPALILLIVLDRPRALLTTLGL